ncbi:pseudouridine synthase [Rhodoferax sp.]|uniref:pseudouridine synthase n=1 Tax=Rhodoferax sp. TaxID=50421 RepID=UPI0025F22336|nr:pseudouridine synthase [Rhodoferax sp.]
MNDIDNNAGAEAVQPHEEIASLEAAHAKVGGNRFDDVVSGQFDADEAAEDVSLPKRVLAPQAETPKLHKVLAQSGMGSRLEMEQLILEGRISVNNEPAHIGQRIQFGDNIKVNGKPIRFRIEPPPARVIAYHKPVGEVVTHDDPQNRPTVFRRLPKLHQGKWQSVGRLDLNTEGLLLFTSSGELANNLMHPRFGLEREYAVRVLGALTKEEKQALLNGVQLDDGIAQFGSIEDGGGEGSNCWYRVTISEGRNREVRRMLESVGHAVSRLIRIRYGAMVLPRGLKRGAWMELDETDIRSLMQAAGTPKARTREEGAFGAGAAPRPRGRGGRQSGRGPAYPKEGSVASQPVRQGGAKPPRQANRQEGGQPDPMKTSLGYIGADSFTRQRQESNGRGRPGGGQRRSGGRSR